ncbi:hypothetical protein [Sulfuriroseicoccus oceanibius]|uniref:Uncharacterized protein n=1 Tax=Sulfuriroseicoccus oceanibius TaxID=2707525 RepID=A0A6B3LBZ9_9BACT|nr:hypothetical protein [Sulfuriroseicoccus oceanibius]QQL46181.1 hypothetical protein G3M56_006260 [Sulfuriroseicoccus oceanibius]
MRSFIVLLGSLAGFALVTAIAFICFFVHNLSANLTVTTNAPGHEPTMPALTETTTP